MVTVGDTLVAAGNMVVAVGCKLVVMGKILVFWSAEIPGKVIAKAEALTGPMTTPGKRVQTINPPGSEVGPGVIATWGKSLEDEADAMGFKWERKGKSSKHIQEYPVQVAVPPAQVPQIAIHSTLLEILQMALTK